MNKYLLLILLTLGLTSCDKKDESYYLKHPKLLQKVAKACPGTQPQGLSCEQIEAIAMRLNTLGYQLQYNPQGFGGKILRLQQSLAQQQLELKSKASDSALIESIAQNKRELADRMAVVKWLESPEG